MGQHGCACRAGCHPRPSRCCIRVAGRAWYPTRVLLGCQSCSAGQAPPSGQAPPRAHLGKPAAPLLLGRPACGMPLSPNSRRLLAAMLCPPLVKAVCRASAGYVLLLVRLLMSLPPHVPSVPLAVTVAAPPPAAQSSRCASVPAPPAPCAASAPPLAGRGSAERTAATAGAVRRRASWQVAKATHHARSSSPRGACCHGLGKEQKWMQRSGATAPQYPGVFLHSSSEYAQHGRNDWQSRIRFSGAYLVIQCMVRRALYPNGRRLSGLSRNQFGK